MRGIILCCLVGILCGGTLLRGGEELTAFNTTSDNIPPAGITADAGIDWCSHNDILCGDWKPMSVEEEIRYYAEELGDLLVALAICESSLNPNAIGDQGWSYGLYQINMRWWADEVSIENAKDIEFSTKWTLNKIRQGQGYLWTCYRTFNLK